MKKYLMPYVAQQVSSFQMRNTKRWLSEQKRKLFSKPHIVSVFLRISDPYSFLLVQVLPDLIQRFDIQLVFHTCLNIDNEMYPYPDRWEHHANADASWLAELYNLNYPEMAIEHKETRILIFTSRLLKVEKSAQALDKIADIFDEYWLRPENDASQIPESGFQEQLTENNSLRKQLGHYLDAMLHYAGEWYWGLDRLAHLEQRLNDLGLNTQSGQILFSRQYDSFCNQQLETSEVILPAVEFYYSARSPYSYIGLERVAALSRYYGLSLIIKPVLPMVMRGLVVPNRKKMYMFLDTKREAARFDIPYGKVADPVGTGVERCYALFEYAKSQDKATDYLLAFGRAVNAEGVHADSLSGMKLIVERTGLDWQIARNILSDSENNPVWKVWAEQNLQELLSSGGWGVPYIRFGKLSTWGQDRIGLIEKELKVLCS